MTTTGNFMSCCVHSASSLFVVLSLVMDAAEAFLNLGKRPSIVRQSNEKNPDVLFCACRLDRFDLGQHKGFLM